MRYPHALAMVLTLTLFNTVPLVGCGTSKSSPERSAPGSTAKATLAWMHDDFAGALKAAKARGVPVVVDMWAPWCHTCLSMQHTVLEDPALEAMGDQFVWVALDTDKAVNAPALEQLPVNIWPTFFVVDSADGAVRARLTGGASAAQFLGFLAQGASAGGAAEMLVRRGDQAAVNKDWATADAMYGQAVASGKLGARVPEVLVMQISARYKAQDWKACLQLGLDKLEAAASSRTASASDFAAYANRCASKVNDAPEEVRRFRDLVLSVVQDVVTDPSSALSVDDRSDGLRIVRAVNEARHGQEAARALGTKLARKQRALLDKAFAAAEPKVAMTYAWPMCEVYHYLGKEAELELRLVELAAALPGQYDPPYRLAWLSWKMGKLDQARASAQKAAALVYGPRKATVLGVLAAIHRARKDAAAEKTTRQAIVTLLEGLPPGQADPKRLKRARAALAKLP